MNVLQKGGRLRLDPFPHVIIEDALPWDLYNTLSDEFPEQKLLTLSEGRENIRMDIPARHAYLLSDTWREFVDYHTSKEFWCEIVDLFGDVAKCIYPALVPNIGEDLKKWSVSVRQETDKVHEDVSNIKLECQPGINSPQTTASKVRGPHLDNPVELFGGLLYMGEGEGDLEIYRLKTSLAFYGKFEVYPSCVELVDVVKYQPNMFVGFLNTQYSVHGVTVRQPTTECRRLVNFGAEVEHLMFVTGHNSY